jgi:hypothetical protein
MSAGVLNAISPTERNSVTDQVAKKISNLARSMVDAMDGSAGDGE